MFLNKTLVDESDDFARVILDGLVKVVNRTLKFMVAS